MLLFELLSEQRCSTSLFEILLPASREDVRLVHLALAGSQAPGPSNGSIYGRLLLKQCNRAPTGDMAPDTTKAAQASRTGSKFTLHPLASTDLHHSSAASAPHRLALINTVSDSCGGIKSFY